MESILCPVRGGPASQPTIQRAVDLARNTGYRLVFLYIVNLDFMSATATSRSHVIKEELAELGQFILETARIKAEEAGVQAEGLIREGQVQEQIILAAKELRARYVVLGAPRGREEKDVFTRHLLEEFAQHIAADSEAEVIFAESL